MDLTNSQRLKTAQGGEITIRIDDGNVYANGAKVINANIITNNGVIHVVDGYSCLVEFCVYWKLKFKVS